MLRFPLFTSFFHQRHLLFGVLLCLLCCLAMLPAVTLAESSPLAAIEKVQSAIDQADSDLLYAAADLDSILNKASDALLASLQEQVAAGNLGDNNLAAAMALAAMAQDSGQSTFIKQLLLTEVKGFVVSGINGGYFAGKPNGRIKPSRSSLASTLDKMPPGRREILPGKVESAENGKAAVSATFVDPEAGRLPLVLGVENQYGQWRIVEISNAMELFEKAGKRVQR